LVGLKSEFEQNLELIDIEFSYRHAVIDSILRILDASVAPSTMDPKVMDGLSMAFCKAVGSHSLKMRSCAVYLLACQANSMTQQDQNCTTRT
jgi:enolase